MNIQISSGKITSSISVQGGLDGASLSKDILLHKMQIDTELFYLSFGILDYKIQSFKSEKKNGNENKMGAGSSLNKNQSKQLKILVKKNESYNEVPLKYFN